MNTPEGRNYMMFAALYGGTVGVSDAFADEGEPIAEVPKDEGNPVNLADEKATTHIIDGDATGGGHAPGRGIPGKSEFPSGWSKDKIMHAISDVATDPASRVTNRGQTTLVDGTKDGVNIRVVMRDGRIVSGYPTNTLRNP
jgi:hypothetical protein